MYHTHECIFQQSSTTITLLYTTVSVLPVLPVVYLFIYLSLININTESRGDALCVGVRVRVKSIDKSIIHN